MATICCKDKTFPNVRAVLFDKDGTLARSELFLRNLAQRRARLIDAQIPGVQEPLLMAFGVEQDRINPTGLMAVGTRWENVTAAAAYVAETGRGWVEAVEIVRSSFAEADRYLPPKAGETPLVEGAMELLQRLTAAGVTLGILSSDSPENVQEFVSHYQLEPYFQAAIGVEAAQAKTHPDVLKQVFLALAVEPAQTVIVGDAATDFQVAQAVSAAGFIGYTGAWTAAIALAEADVQTRFLDEIKVLM